MNKIKKLLSFALALVFLFLFSFNNVYAVEKQDGVILEIHTETGSLSSAFDGTFVRDYVNNEMLDEAGHVARLPEEEKLDTYVFLNRDGTKSVYYMDENVRYVDENGEKIEKDLTIIRKNKGYTLKANDVKLWFPDVLSDGISVKYDNFHLTLYPQGVADTKEVVIDKHERITYPGVFGENTVLAYTPTLSGLKEDIILSEYTGQLSYDFLIHTHGMQILEEEGKYIVKNPGNGNKETFELGAVQIYDSAGNFCMGEMKITEQNNGSKYILTLTAPEEFLTDPETVYPVTIDPTLKVSGTNNIQDSIVYSGTPNANYGNNVFLNLGYCDNTLKIGRAVFRLPGLYNSSAYINTTANNIVSVKFYVWDASGHSTSNIKLCVNTEKNWTESGVTWNNKPNQTDRFGYSGDLPSNQYGCFDITDLVRTWKSGMYSKEAGFTLVNPNETNSIYTKVPCSSEYSNANCRPYVVMTIKQSGLTAFSIGGEFHGGADVVNAHNTWSACGYESTYTTNPTINDLSQSALNKTILYFSSHGTQHTLDLLNNLHLTDDVPEWTLGTVSIANYTFENTSLVIYDACLTASTNGGSMNLCEKTFQRGADCVVGWTVTINQLDALTWQSHFQTKLLEGATVNEAIIYADYFLQGSNITNPTVKGNRNIVINPQTITNN